MPRFDSFSFPDVGALAGSTFTWQAFPTIGVALSKRAWLEFGYLGSTSMT